MIICVYFLFWILRLMVLDSAVHKLNHVHHELLHMWRKVLACSIVWGETLLCLIFFPLLYWVCMNCGICSVPLLVLCSRRLLYVFPMMLYHLVYSVLLFLSLVGLVMCGCNRII